MSLSDTLKAIKSNALQVKAGTKTSEQAKKDISKTITDLRKKTSSKSTEVSISSNKPSVFKHPITEKLEKNLGISEPMETTKVIETAKHAPKVLTREGQIEWAKKQLDTKPASSPEKISTKPDFKTTDTNNVISNFVSKFFPEGSKIRKTFGTESDLQYKRDKTVVAPNIKDTLSVFRQTINVAKEEGMTPEEFKTQFFSTLKSNKILSEVKTESVDISDSIYKNIESQTKDNMSTDSEIRKEVKKMLEDAGYTSNNYGKYMKEGIIVDGQTIGQWVPGDQSTFGYKYFVDQVVEYQKNKIKQNLDDYNKNQYRIIKYGDLKDLGVDDSLLWMLENTDYKQSKALEKEIRKSLNNPNYEKTKFEKAYSDAYDALTENEKGNYNVRYVFTPGITSGDVKLEEIKYYPGGQKYFDIVEEGQRPGYPTKQELIEIGKETIKPEEIAKLKDVNIKGILSTSPFYAAKKLDITKPEDLKSYEEHIWLKFKQPEEEIKSTYYDRLPPDLRLKTSFVTAMGKAMTAVLTFPEFIAEEVGGRTWTGITSLGQKFEPVEIVPIREKVGELWEKTDIGQTPGLIEAGMTQTVTGLTQQVEGAPTYEEYMKPQMEKYEADYQQWLKRKEKALEKGDIFSEKVPSSPADYFGYSMKYGVKSEPWKRVERQPFEAGFATIGEIAGFYFGGKGLSAIKHYGYTIPVKHVASPVIGGFKVPSWISKSEFGIKPFVKKFSGYTSKISDLKTSKLLDKLKTVRTKIDDLSIKPKLTKTQMNKLDDLIKQESKINAQLDKVSTLERIGEIPTIKKIGTGLKEWAYSEPIVPLELRLLSYKPSNIFGRAWRKALGIEKTKPLVSKEVISGEQVMSLETGGAKAMQKRFETYMTPEGEIPVIHGTQGIWSPTDIVKMGEQGQLAGAVATTKPARFFWPKETHALYGQRTFSIPVQKETGNWLWKLTKGKFGKSKVITTTEQWPDIFTYWVTPEDMSSWVLGMSPGYQSSTKLSLLPQRGPSIVFSKAKGFESVPQKLQTTMGKDYAKYYKYMTERPPEPVLRPSYKSLGGGTEFEAITQSLLKYTKQPSWKITDYLKSGKSFEPYMTKIKPVSPFKKLTDIGTGLKETAKKSYETWGDFWGRQLGYRQFTTLWGKPIPIRAYEMSAPTVKEGTGVLSLKDFTKQSQKYQKALQEYSRGIKTYSLVSPTSGLFTFHYYKSYEPTSYPEYSIPKYRQSRRPKYEQYRPRTTYEPYKPREISRPYEPIEPTYEPYEPYEPTYPTYYPRYGYEPYGKPSPPRITPKVPEKKKQKRKKKVKSPFDIKYKEKEYIVPFVAEFKPPKELKQKDVFVKQSKEFKMKQPKNTFTKQKNTKRRKKNEIEPFIKF